MRGANGPQNSSLIQNIEETCVKCQNGCVGVGSVGGEEELWMSNKQHLRWNIQKQQLGIHKPVPGWQAKAVSLSQFWVEQVDLHSPGRFWAMMVKAECGGRGSLNGWIFQPRVCPLCPPDEWKRVWGWWRLLMGSDSSANPCLPNVCQLGSSNCYWSLREACRPQWGSY